MDYQLQIGQNAEQTYHTIRQSIVSAQHKLSAAVNSAMVTTYWEIGEQIYKACGENDRAEYGKRLLEYLSSQLTAVLLHVPNSLHTVERIELVALPAADACSR